MISRIKGTLSQISDEYALIENGGVFYEVRLPSALADRMKDQGKVGQEVCFETIHFIEAGDRKSNHYPRLVGFTDPIDREFFSLYTQVPGLGIKKALKSLIMPISEIASAIELKDAARLTRLPGIGTRLADKIVAELFGKTAKFALARSSEPLAAKTSRAPAYVDEALDILEQLQYSRVEAQTMVEAAIKAEPKITQAEELISVIFRTAQEMEKDS